MDVVGDLGLGGAPPGANALWEGALAGDSIILHAVSFSPVAKPCTIGIERLAKFDILRTLGSMTQQAPGALLSPHRDELDLGAVLHALSDPVRLRIVAALAEVGDGRACGSFDLPVTKSTCTHHFRVLREAGVISQRHVGTTRLNTLRSGDLEARFPGLLATVLRAAGGPPQR